MQAMIFAAGLGTRLKPITDHKPKALVEVGGESLLKRVITRLSEAGADRLVVNVHHFADQIIRYLTENKNFGLDIRISDESDKLLDTGGGLRKAAPLFKNDEPILIHNVDILSNVDLQKFYRESVDNAATLLVSERETKRYLLFDDDMRLVGWTNIETGEVRSPDAALDVARCRKFAFAGIHTFSPALFRVMNNWPAKFSIIDLYLNTVSQAPIYGYLQPDLRLIDVGKTVTLNEADAFLKTI